MGRRVTNPDSEYDRLRYKLWIIPQQLERAYRRVEQLEKEARELGLTGSIRSKTQ